MNYYCSEYSRASGEQQIGTANRVDVWLLIEHRGRWERDAAESLPDDARRAAEGFADRYENSRIALIRQNGRSTGPLSCFIALSKESGSKLFPFSIDNHHALAELDFDAVLELPWSPQKLFLACTHGVHDRCCAKFGNAILQELERSAPNDVWQISHIGGCRFAPNVLVLPEGLVYGRVTAADCADIVQHPRTGRIVPALIRGRSCYPKPVQAAECFVRTEVTDSGTLHLESADHSGNEWTIAFQCGGELISVVVAVEDSSVSTYKNCAAKATLPRMQYALTKCEELCPAVAGQFTN